ncbi:MAG: hypothetical protein JRI84_16130 [Deltaproteobacteria bacterium]|nr:hypothetical protein [Deltaproteobacteria bacterium]
MMAERWKLFKGAKSLFSAKDLSGSGGGTGWAAETGSPPGWEAFFRFGPAEWKGCLRIQQCSHQSSEATKVADDREEWGGCVLSTSGDGVSREPGCRKFGIPLGLDHRAAAFRIDETPEIARTIS